MSARLIFKDSSNTSEVSSLVFSPSLRIGQRYSEYAGSWMKNWIANVGDTALSNVAITLLQVGSYALVDYMYVAPDNGSNAPSEEDAIQYGETLNLGALGVGSSKAIYHDAALPSGASDGTQQWRTLAVGEL